MELPIHLYNTKLLDAVSMGANASSSSKNINETRSFAVQVSWTGTSPVGTITIFGSNDDSNYTSLTTVSVAANSGSSLYNASDAGYSFVKVTYTFTSGTGSLTAIINGKR